MSKPTCGPLYKETRDRWAGDDEESIRGFTAGWVGGQAEKVYLGACAAAMFRPSADRRPMLLEIVHDIAPRYGLAVWDLGEEVWIARADDNRAAFALAEMAGCEPDSPRWHRLRGALCGVPMWEIDEKFHERRGYGQRCD